MAGLPRGFDVDDVDGLLRGVRLGLCALIDSGRLQDVYFSMSAVAAVNVGLFYPVSVDATASKSAAGSPALRSVSGGWRRRRREASTRPVRRRRWRTRTTPWRSAQEERGNDES
jgi:hypothetical protein